MARKKDKPTLIDLIDKDKFKMPDWVKGTAERAAENRNSSKKYPNTAPDGMVINNRPAQNGQGEPQDQAAVKEPYRPNRMIFRKQLIAGGALFLLILFGVGIYLAFNKSEVASPQPQDAQTAIADNQADSPQDSTGLNQATVNPNVIPKPIPREHSAAARQGQCIIICGSRVLSEVEPVAEFFRNNGMEVVIGFQSGRYIMTTYDTFSSANSDEFRALKAKVVEIGKKYIDQRPAGAPRYVLQTFEGAYAANVDAIKFD